jgi:acyl-coenzyme A synthetase/AMP-(fatty) acid ligase
MSDLTWLLDRFTASQAKPFMVWHDQAFTYRQLLDSVEEWRVRLADAQISPGMVVAIEGDYSPSVVALFLALLELNAIIVPLTASVAVHKPEFIAIAEVQKCITFSDQNTFNVTDWQAKINNALTLSLIEQKKPGLVLFSSGSTGKSKAALHNFEALLAKFVTQRHSFITLTFLLLDHIGGLNTLFYILSNTGTIIAVASRDPDQVCRAIQAHHVELLPTSPTFINLLLISGAYERYDLSSLKRITYGTETMPAQTLQRLHELLPAVELQQTYGLSEIGILRSKSRSPESLWVKVGGEGIETQVRDGILWVRTPSAMCGYLNAPSPFDSEGWFNTGDAVEVDGDYIKILGRQSEIINVGGAKVYPAEVENVLLEMPNVRDVVVAGEANPITGHIVVARFNLFEAEALGDLRRRMRQHCRERLAIYKIPTKIEIVSDKQYSERYKKMRRLQDQ